MLKFNTPLYTDMRLWLAVTVVVILVLLWVLLTRLFHRDPPGFFWRTFMDDRGIPDGKMIAVSHSMFLLTVMALAGTLNGRWPPFYVWATFDIIVVAGLFGVTYVTKKFYDSGGSTDPAPDFGLSAPAAPAATSTALTDLPADEEPGPAPVMRP